MIKVRFIAAILLFLNISSQAISQTIVPLNTGYNHSPPGVYPVGAQDNYWINLATSPTTSPPAGPSNVILSQAPWLPALPAE